MSPDIDYLRPSISFRPSLSIDDRGPQSDCIEWRLHYRKKRGSCTAKLRIVTLFTKKIVLGYCGVKRLLVDLDSRCKRRYGLTGFNPIFFYFDTVVSAPLINIAHSTAARPSN